MQKKGEKTSPENLVPICPALSRFVRVDEILRLMVAELETGIKKESEVNHSLSMNPL